jgi:hypothetical protein
VHLDVDRIRKCLPFPGFFGGRGLDYDSDAIRHSMLHFNCVSELYAISEQIIKKILRERMKITTAMNWRSSRIPVFDQAITSLTRLELGAKEKILKDVSIPQASIAPTTTRPAIPLLDRVHQRE